MSYSKSYNHKSLDELVKTSVLWQQHHFDESNECEKVHKMIFSSESIEIFDCKDKWQYK